MRINKATLFSGPQCLWRWRCPRRGTRCCRRTTRRCRRSRRRRSSRTPRTTTTTAATRTPTAMVCRNWANDELYWKAFFAEKNNKTRAISYRNLHVCLSFPFYRYEVLYLYLIHFFYGGDGWTCLPAIS